MKSLLIAFVGLSVALAGCDRPKQNRAIPNFASEDECEDYGMSDSFCDAMFPEMEDFFGKKKKKTQASTYQQKPSRYQTFKSKVKSVGRSSSSRSSSGHKK